MTMYRIGLDIGSVSVNVAVMDEKNIIVSSRYVRHMGKPFQAAKEVLEELSGRFEIEFVSTTGTGAKDFSSLIGAPFVNEIVALAKAFDHLYPHIRGVIDIGGEDSKLILFEQDGTGERLHVKDFSMNALCAAGTGSFLDQQASTAPLYYRGIFRSCPQINEPPEDCREVYCLCKIRYDPSPANCNT